MSLNPPAFSNPAVGATPDEWAGGILAGSVAHRFPSATLRASERLYIDTWGTKATTTDARYLYDIIKELKGMVKDGELIVQAGGGIVADSDPETEFQESLNKAKALLRAADEAGRYSGNG